MGPCKSKEETITPFASDTSNGPRYSAAILLKDWPVVDPRFRKNRRRGFREDRIPQQFYASPDTTFGTEWTRLTDDEYGQVLLGTKSWAHLACDSRESVVMVVNTVPRAYLAPKTVISGKIQILIKWYDFSVSMTKYRTEISIPKLPQKEQDQRKKALFLIRLFCAEFRNRISGQRKQSRITAKVVSWNRSPKANWPYITGKKF